MASKVDGYNVDGHNADDEADGEGPHDVMMYPWLLYARLRRTKSIIIWPISFERKTVA